MYFGQEVVLYSGFSSHHVPTLLFDERFSMNRKEWWLALFAGYGEILFLGSCDGVYIFFRKMHSESFIHLVPQYI